MNKNNKIEEGEIRSIFKDMADLSLPSSPDAVSKIVEDTMQATINFDCSNVDEFIESMIGCLNYRLEGDGRINWRYDMTGVQFYFESHRTSYRLDYVGNKLIIKAIVAYLNSPEIE